MFRVTAAPTSLLHMQLTGRRPEARFLGLAGGEYLRDAEVRNSFDRVARVEFILQALNRRKAQGMCCLLLQSSGLQCSSPLAAALSAGIHRLTLYVMDVQITWDDLKAAEHAVGEFGGDNRAGVQVNILEGNLHKSSAGSRVAASDVL